jgi:hypothetical protein
MYFSPFLTGVTIEKKGKDISLLFFVYLFKRFIIT